MTDTDFGRILIVDDEPTNIEVLVDLLEEEFDLLVTTDGSQVVDLASSDPVPDLILLDVVMPGLDGYRVCAQLKQDARTRDLPIIFITGLGDPKAEERGLEAGAVDYIAKPFNSAVVRRRIHLHIELKRARDRMAQLATMDGLTGIHNRRQFDNILEMESRRLTRGDAALLSLILIDIDHFKEFNDTYGHVAGDECLRRIAQLINQLMKRGPDLVARYGGEEFVCILPGTDRDGATALAERVRAGIASLRIPHVASSAAPHVTASLGVATVTQATQGFVTDIIQRADKQLYLAKQSGRNRVMVADIDDTGTPAIGIPGIDMGAGLSRVRGNSQLYHSLLRNFFERNRGLARDFWQLLKNRDLERIQYLAHNFKGVSANLGACDLSHAAGSLAEVVASPAVPAPEAVEPVLQRFESRLSDLLGGLDTYFATYDRAHSARRAQVPVDDLGQVGAIMTEALAHLDHDLGVTLDLLSSVESRLRTSALCDEFAALEHYLAEFDTDQARGMLAGLVDALGTAAATPAADLAPPAAVDARPRIVIVDDAPENLLILVEALKDQYAISATRNGAQALALAAAVPPPDIILLNIMLPGIDGYEVCRRLKENDTTKSIPVIFLTGFESVDNEALGLRLGAADYLRKPVTYPVLALRVKLHLALEESRRRLEGQNLQLLKEARQREEIDRIIQHDLHSPLGTIVEATRLLQSSPALAEELKQLVGDVEGAAGDIARLITNTANILRM